mgnify:CR=1 FL=1
MWNGKFASLLIGSAAAIAIVHPAWAARTQDYTIAQFVSVLNGLGYAVPLNAPPTDPRVQQAIRDFQVQYRLPVDGTLNLPTQDRAAGVIKALQTQLNKVVKPSPQLPGTQFYGKQTEAAVRQFQQQNNLPVTGIATIETRQRLEAIFNDAVPRTDGSSPPVTSNPTPAPNPGTSLGIYTEGQFKAVLLGFGYDINPNAPLTDPAIVRAIRELQQIYGLSETGQADRATQETLAQVVRNLRNNLRKVLQSDLAIAQVYDAATQAAVRQFQSRFRLRVNGRANLEVRSRIDQAARRKG